MKKKMNFEKVEWNSSMESSQEGVNQHKFTKKYLKALYLRRYLTLKVHWDYCLMYNLHTVRNHQQPLLSETRLHP